MPLQENEVRLFNALEIKDPQTRYQEIKSVLKEFTEEVDINRKNCRGHSPLWMAVEEKLKNQLSTLSEVTLHAKNRYGKSPLLIAVENEDYECVRLLVEAQASPNDRDCQNNTVSMTAVEKGDPNVIKLLLRANANMSYGTHYFTPLQIAMEKENFTVINLLLESKVTVRDVNGLCRLLAKRKRFDLLNTFLQHYPEHRYDVIHHVILYKLNEFAAVILQGCADNTLRLAVDCAMHSNNIELLHELLRRVQYLKQTQVQNLLFYAAKISDVGLAEKLIEAKADVNLDKGFVSILSTAVHSGDLALIKVLLEAKADVNKKTTAGTPLLTAIQKSDLGVVRVLLEAKADPNQEVAEYQYDFLPGAEFAPLYWAVRDGNVELIRTLIEFHANVNDPDMRKVFRVAAQNGHVEIVEILIQQKANADKVDLNFENYLTKTFELSKRRAECMALIQNYVLDKSAAVEPSFWMKKVRGLFHYAEVKEPGEEKARILGKKS